MCLQQIVTNCWYFASIADLMQLLLFLCNSDKMMLVMFKHISLKQGKEDAEGAFRTTEDQ